MADHRIHPSTVPPQESAKAPLMPADTSSSSSHNPPPASLPPALHPSPPNQKTQRRRRRRSCCCRCFCCTLSTILLLLISIAAALGILFLIFRPKVPHYSVESIAITGFNITSNTLSSKFLLSLTAANPNKKIGIYYYEEGSDISAWMENTMLCRGTFPHFYQGHGNTTLLSLPLSGQTTDATQFLNRARDLQAAGALPLVLRAKVPVRIKLGRLRLVKLKFKARCALTVDSVSSDNTIRVSSRGCKIRVRL